MAQKLADGAERASFVRHGKLRRSNGWLNALRVLLTAAIVVVLSGVATVSYAVWGIAKELDTVDLATSSGGGQADAVAAGSTSIDGELTILLVGSDTRQGQSYDDGEEGELNDVTLLLHVSADHQNATVVSFPRDLMLAVPSCPSADGQENYYPAMSEQQLNSTMMYGGLSCTVLTIEQLTGMDIPYAGLITFDGVIGISEALGGVDVCLTEPIVDEKTDLNLPAGENTLVGETALQFLRTRYGVGDGSDTSRISNQQVYMSALVQKLKSADTLSDPVKVYALAKAAVENITLSSNMASVEFIQAIAGTVKDIDLDHINFVQYPSGAHPYESGRLTPDYANGQILMDAIMSGSAISVTGVGKAVETADSDDDGSEDATDETTEAEAEEGATDDAGDSEQSKDSGDAKDSGDDTVELPDAITGLSGSSEACSAGRTVY